MNPAPLLVSLDAPPAGGLLGSPLTMMVVFVAIFYFFLIRPQQKEQKEQAALVASLQKGDRVVTAAGIHGRIHEARADTLVLEIASNTFLTVDRESVRKKVIETPAPTEKA